MRARTSTSSRSRTVAIGLALGLAVRLLAGGIAIAAAGEPAGATADQPDGYSLEQLRSGGTQVAGAPPSLRWFGSSSSVYIDYPNHNPLQTLGSGGTSDWQVQNLLEPGQTLPVDELRLHFRRQRGAGEETVRLRVVFWELGERTVTTPNGSVTQPAAVNQTVVTKEIHLSNAFETKTIDLRRHEDRVRTTMWLVDNPEAKWTFAHESRATTKPVPFETWGGLGWWLLTRVLLITGVGVAMVFGLAKAALRRADAPPMKGSVWWLFWGSVATLLMVAAAWDGLTALFVRLPWLVSGVITLVVGVLFLEGWNGGVWWAQFERPRPADVRSINDKDDEILDEIEEDIRQVRMVSHGADGDDNSVALVRPGIRQFLARVFAGPATIDLTDLKTRVRCNGDVDHKYYVSPPEDPEDPGRMLEFTPAHWSFDFPSIRETVTTGGDPLADDADEQPSGTETRTNWSVIVGGLLLFGGGYVVGELIVGRWLDFGTSVGRLVGLAAALLGVVAYAATARGGSVGFDSAPVHQRSAKATTILQRETIQDAQTFEEQEKELARLRSQPVKRAYALLGARNEQESKEMHDIYGEYRPEEWQSDRADGGETEASADD